jgi:hypothetical protein
MPIPVYMLKPARAAKPKRRREPKRKLKETIELWVADDPCLRQLCGFNSGGGRVILRVDVVKLLSHLGNSLPWTKPGEPVDRDLGRAIRHASVDPIPPSLQLDLLLS